MADFHSLDPDLQNPDLQKRILRPLLLQEGPINLEKLDEITEHGTAHDGYRMHPMLGLSHKIDDVVADVFFGENTFELAQVSEIAVFNRRISPWHKRWVRKIMFTWSYASAPDFKLLLNFENLEHLTIKLDEAAMTEHQIGSHGRADRWHRSLEVGPQLGLQLLHAPGITTFRSLRGLKKVSLIPKTRTHDGHEAKGPIPGGLFQTLIKSEIMQDKGPPYKREGVFRFFDLSPELRNLIYAHVLTFPGATYPSPATPTSVKCLYKNTPTIKRAALSPPHSALSLLLASRGIRGEAEGLFYSSNDLVFTYPSHLQGFLSTLGSIRQNHISSLTLFHRSRNEGGIDTIDVAINLLRQLKTLKKFHLLVKYQLALQGNPGEVAGVKPMFALRNIQDTKLRDIELEDRVDEAGAHKGHTFSVADKAVHQRQADALKHFNRGLAMAQTGDVVHELYTTTNWHIQTAGLWPVLNGSTCSYDNGCSCRT